MPYTLSTTIISISLSLHLVLLAPVNSCELHNYYLVLSFCSCIRVVVCLPMFFPNKTNINIINTKGSQRSLDKFNRGTSRFAVPVLFGHLEASFEVLYGLL